MLISYRKTKIKAFVLFEILVALVIISTIFLNILFVSSVEYSKLRLNEVRLIGNSVLLSAYYKINDTISTIVRSQNYPSRIYIRISLNTSTNNLSDINFTVLQSSTYTSEINLEQCVKGLSFQEFRFYLPNRFNLNNIPTCVLVVLKKVSNNKYLYDGVFTYYYMDRIESDYVKLISYIS
ncbi:MAG: hypothetical protein NZZ41_07070 [Candidatus Dojkabacteria bacterium]|nr:hypothetical protein [Candidatus Dojkabacteria bacterium]